MNKNPPPGPQNPRTLLRPFHGIGLFITATNTDTGKTTVTAALAAALHRLRIRVGICKPVASGCPTRPNHIPSHGATLSNEDLASPDAEFALRAAGLDPTDPEILRYASPMRYAIPVSPHVAARIEERPMRWDQVVESLNYWEENCDVLLIEGAGGWLVPLDDNYYTIADMATALHLPVLVITDPFPGSLNFTSLTVQAIRQRGLVPAGLVVNHFPAKNPDLVASTNIEELPKVSGVPIRAVFPQLPAPEGAHGLAFPEIPTQLVDLITPFAHEWYTMAKAQADAE